MAQLPPSSLCHISSHGCSHVLDTLRHRGVFSWKESIRLSHYYVSVVRFHVCSLSLTPSKSIRHLGVQLDVFGARRCSGGLTTVSSLVGTVVGSRTVSTYILVKLRSTVHSATIHAHDGANSAVHTLVRASPRVYSTQRLCCGASRLRVAVQGALLPLARRCCVDVARIRYMGFDACVHKFRTSVGSGRYDGRTGVAAGRMVNGSC